MLIFSCTTFGYALAAFLPKESKPEPKILGTFTMTVNVNEVENLYAWQVVIKYDSKNLELIEASPGGFLGVVLPEEINDDNVHMGIFLGPAVTNNLIMMGGTLIGGVPGKSGSGELAKITFGYYTINYTLPEIILEKGTYKTMLLDPEGNMLPIGENTLTLSLVG